MPHLSPFTSRKEPQCPVYRMLRRFWAVWVGVEQRKSLALTRIRTQNCPAHSELLNQQCYPSNYYYSTVWNSILSLTNHSWPTVNISNRFKKHTIFTHICSVQHEMKEERMDSIFFNFTLHLRNWFDYSQLPFINMLKNAIGEWKLHDLITWVQGNLLQVFQKMRSMAMWCPPMAQVRDMFHRDWSVGSQVAMEVHIHNKRQCGYTESLFLPLPPFRKESRKKRSQYQHWSTVKT